MKNDIIKTLVSYSNNNSKSLEEWVTIINEIQTKAKQYLHRIYKWNT